MAPRARVCYICGRQYMLHSFAIHEAQCRELFEKREALKPPKERRKCPSDPFASTGYSNSSAKLSSKTLDEMNAMAMNTWSSESLVPCENCGRKFLPEKLIIHRRSCTSLNPSRRVGESVNAAQRSKYEESESYDMESRSNRRKSVNFEENPQNEAGLYGLNKCPSCGRSFNDESFPKHQRICKKVFASKRKVFDSSKHRTKGTELEAFQRFSKTKASSASKYSGKMSQTYSEPIKRNDGGMPKWKVDSLNFRRAMQEAKKVSLAEAKSKATGIPLHQLLDPPSYVYRDDGYGGYGDTGVHKNGVMCPHCGRTFSEAAGERHIPQCKNIINKPSRLVRGNGKLSHPTTTTTSSTMRSYLNPSINKSSSFRSLAQNNFQTTQTSSFTMNQPSDTGNKVRSSSTGRYQRSSNLKVAQTPPDDYITAKRPSVGRMGIDYGDDMYGSSAKNDASQQYAKNASSNRRRSSDITSGHNSSQNMKSNAYVSFNSNNYMKPTSSGNTTSSRYQPTRSSAGGYNISTSNNSEGVASILSPHMYKK